MEDVSARLLALPLSPRTNDTVPKLAQLLCPSTLPCLKKVSSHSFLPPSLPSLCLCLPSEREVQCSIAGAAAPAASASSAGAVPVAMPREAQHREGCRGCARMGDTNARLNDAEASGSASEVRCKGQGGSQASGKAEVKAGGSGGATNVEGESVGDELAVESADVKGQQKAGGGVGETQSSGGAEGVPPCVHGAAGVDAGLGAGIESGVGVGVVLRGPWIDDVAEDRRNVRLDISFEGGAHSGLRTAKLVGDVWMVRRIQGIMERLTECVRQL